MRARERPTLRAWLAVSLVLGTLALDSCSGDRQPDLSNSKAVSFEATDGIHLEGRVFGQGTKGVILAHMLPADQTSWFDFAGRLADDGYLVLTFDFRGYCPGGDAGCSQGERVIPDLPKDVDGAIRYLRDEHGAKTISLVGASMGGTASLVSAAEPANEIRAVITLSAPTEIDGLAVDADLLSQVSAGKLFIASTGDAEAAASAETLYDQSPPPKRVDIEPADDHGTDLLTGPRGEVVRRLIETYLETNGS